MSGIPYNRLQTVEATAKTDNGETVVIETLHYAFVVPCHDCKYANDSCSVCYRGGDTGDDLYYPEITSDGFCAWGERKDGDAR